MHSDIADIQRRLKEAFIFLKEEVHPRVEGFMDFYTGCNPNQAIRDLAYEAMLGSPEVMEMGVYGRYIETYMSYYNDLTARRVAPGTFEPNLIFIDNPVLSTGPDSVIMLSELGETRALLKGITPLCDPAGIDPVKNVVVATYMPNGVVILTIANQR